MPVGPEPSYAELAAENVALRAMVEAPPCRATTTSATAHTATYATTLQEATAAVAKRDHQRGRGRDPGASVQTPKPQRRCGSSAVSTKANDATARYFFDPQRTQARNGLTRAAHVRWPAGSRFPPRCTVPAAWCLGTVEEQVPGVQQLDSVGRVLDVRDHVAAQQHRAAQPVDQLDHVGSLLGVQPVVGSSSSTTAGSETSAWSGARRR